MKNCNLRAPHSHCCVSVEKLSVQLGNHSILKEVDLHVDCGELLAIVGPNGAGKTTLLRSILREIPFRGKVSFQLKGETRGNFRIGYVPQKINYDTDSPISVLDLMAVAFGARPVWLGITDSLRKEISAALAKVSSEHLIDQKIGELSGGELQRVFLAMAMSPLPSLLLLDEPLSAVDAKGLALFYELVSELRKIHDVAIIMVTHDIAGIAPYADRMILLNRTVMADGKPEKVLADSELLHAHGPGLWNISKLLDVCSHIRKENHHD